VVIGEENLDPSMAGFLALFLGRTKGEENG